MTIINGYPVKKVNNKPFPYDSIIPYSQTENLSRVNFYNNDIQIRNVFQHFNIMEKLQPFL